MIYLYKNCVGLLLVLLDQLNLFVIYFVFMLLLLNTMCCIHIALLNAAIWIKEYLLW